MRSKPIVLRQPHPYCGENDATMWKKTRRPMSPRLEGGSYGVQVSASDVSDTTLYEPSAPFGSSIFVLDSVFESGA